MPIPQPHSGEKREDFIARCMGDEVMNSEYPDNDQRAAVCYSQWRKPSKKDAGMSPNDNLLQAIRARQQKKSEFAYGILTADRYVKTLQDCVGVEACWRYASTKGESFHDVLTKAAGTLVYSNPDMRVEDRYNSLPEEYEGLVLPKNTLMVFRHVLTTPRKDRDGDVLRTQGATVDPSLLLLWQHVHTLPIGKMLLVSEHNTKRLCLVSAIVDVNDLAHDSAVMIDNGMGRFSHGFRALEFVEEKAGAESGSGFDVKKFEVLEASLVSVPSNVDAEVEEVMLSLVEGRKLTSPLLKQVGREIRERRPTSVPVNIEFNLKFKEPRYENILGSGSPAQAGAGSGTKDCACASKEAHATRGEKQAAAQTHDPQVKATLEGDDKKTCPKCGGSLDERGHCSKCGRMGPEEEKERPKLPPKAAQVDEPEETDNPGEEAQECPECGAEMQGDSCPDCGYEREKPAKKAMAEILARATPQERKQLQKILQTMDEADRRQEQVKTLHRLISHT